jgi:hypothetical protein
MTNRLLYMSSKKLIPTGTIVPIRLAILTGGYNDPSQGWTEGYATASDGGSIYLRVELSVIDGRYTGIKFRSVIGLKSPKGPYWRKRGRALITNILNSSADLASNDFSEKARKYRRLKSLGEINGIKLCARVKTIKDQNGNLKNEIDEVIISESDSSTLKVAKLRQTDLTSKLTASVAQPIWMMD